MLPNVAIVIRVYGVSISLQQTLEMVIIFYQKYGQNTGFHLRNYFHVEITYFKHIEFDDCSSLPGLPVAFLVPAVPK